MRTDRSRRWVGIFVDVFGKPRSWQNDPNEPARPVSAFTDGLPAAAVNDAL